VTTETVTLGKALNLGLRRALEADDKVVIMGEDVGKLGGVFRITDGLQKDFGEERVIDTPLAESGIIGTAIGLAIRGYRPVCEIQFDGFVYPAYDQIVSQVAKIHYRSGGAVRLPIVIRIPFGGGIGAVEHHSESPEAYFAHTPGLKVVTCSNPLDAYWMIQQAIAADDPVIFFEPKRRYWDKAEVDTSATLADAYPLHAARVVRAAAEGSARELEVIDLRSLSPLDLASVYASVRRTGRAIVVHEAARSGGLGGEIASRITEECFYSLEAPVLRVTGFDIPYPPAKFEDEYLPDIDRILDAVDRGMEW
jgi:2-oxoisovalerate dehydrogenase E1 component beta subunit